MLTADRARTLCNELLMDVPLARAGGSADTRLAALLRAAVFFPARADGTSPVDGWLVEAAQLAATLDDREAQAMIAARRAVCAMRRLRFDAALGEVDAAMQFGPSPATATWIAATRARTLVRAQRLDEARAALGRIPASIEVHWSAGLIALARAELELQGGEPQDAQPLYDALVDTLDERLVEDHIDVLQSLGFCCLARLDARAGARRLQQARDILEALGLQPEVAQMDLALGHLHLVLDERREAQRLLEEARALLAGPAQSGVGARELQALSEMGLALAHAQCNAPAEARAAAARAASLFGRSGNAPGYLAMLLLVASLYEGDHDFAGAYKTLAIGQAAARHLGWTQTGVRLQREIARLRDEVVGAQRFEALAAHLLEELKTPHAGPAVDQGRMP